MAHRNHSSGFLTEALRGLGRNLTARLPRLSESLRGKTEETSHRLRRLYERTSSQVLEKTEETRKTVRLRMAILDIEHHLNRLYPDIGKTACDLWEIGKTPLRSNRDLRSKVELVKEYRARRNALNEELQALMETKKKGD